MTADWLIRLLKMVSPRPLWTLLGSLMPKSMAIATTHGAWQRDDPQDWPLPESLGKTGVAKYEYSLFSQNGEDGILRYLYDEIGFGSRTFLEFGFGIAENNSLRLVLQEQFRGAYIDGSATSVRRFNDAAKSFGSGLSNVRAIHRFLDLENLQAAILECGLPGEIDLLSIDVDGNDYWFWQGIECLLPRVVVIEYNASLGSELSLTVPYDPRFDRHQKHGSGFYCGASIKALESLGKKKGYTLVACDSNGVNAFFVRNDLLTSDLKRLSSLPAYRPHRNRLARGYSMEDQFRVLQDMPFVTVE